ncbi:MAG TPA: M23 family metallopeptidase [Chryseosolibacter sp.]|nr:M23 family metallopeptidase [Chryseosolibacter sp.]
MLRKIIVTSVAIVAFIAAGFLIPETFTCPVKGADRRSYHPRSFWYHPWGRSGTHKGVDIFAKEGTEVRSSTGGLVVFSGTNEMGGNVVLILGPKWKLHYYAHLKEIKTGFLSWTSPKDNIGSVGTTGNAKGRPPHLHYSLVTLVPYPWRADQTQQGWKKMFYLDPISYLRAAGY